jgi:hypothetical protein
VSIPEYWWPYLYQYGVGLVIFLIGLTLILGYRSCVLSRQQDRFWFGVLIFGLCWYAGIHLLWYLAAIFIMPEAAGGSG